MKIFTMILLAAMSCQLVYAQSVNDTGRLTVLEEKYSTLYNKQAKTEGYLSKLDDRQKEYVAKIKVLISENIRQKLIIDSLQNKCKLLDVAMSVDRKDFNGKIDETNNNVQVSRDMLQNRILWVSFIVVVLLVIIIIIAYLLTKRIKSRDRSIAEVRKAQDAFYSAQIKMQEEAVKLDDKLLQVLDKQISGTQRSIDKNSPDHSLALKVADEIVRIELNMSRMDASVKGYKQLAKAVERIKDNFKANGYEIIDMLGKPYNDGMKVVANFVADDNIEFGKQIITGITKPQINYNGQMIQSAQITVSQNI